MRVPVPEEILAAERLGRVHLVGIGGAGLSGIARLMLARGIEVSGSDGTASASLDSLRAQGVTVHVGHDAANLSHLEAGDTVVVSTAIPDTNPEYLEAQARGLRVLPRSAALAALMVGRRVVAVAGTHGKTTTTSLLTVALQSADADPSYAIGGDLAATGVNAAQGSSDLFVAEADESDGAFLVYRPFGAIITNVDADHLDYWSTEDAYAAGFVAFAGNIDPGGFAVCCIDDAGAARVAGHATDAGVRVVTVSTRDPGADVVPADLEGIELWAPGEHYLTDALAAYAAGLELGCDPALLRAGLASYTGTRRRMELKGEAVGVRVYDSYAHHPAEIAGDLQSARVLAHGGRLVVAFQPHLVSRTQALGSAMGQALGAADAVVVTDIYLAREQPDPTVTGALVADAVPVPTRFVPELADVAGALADLAEPGDLVLTLGAGDITSVGPEVLRLLEERRED